MATRGKQGSKDSDAKRVNFDNERESKFDKQYERRPSQNGSKSGRRSRKRDNNNGSKPKSSGATASSNLISVASNYRNTQVVGSKLPFFGPTGRGQGATRQGYQIVPGILVLHWSPNFGTLSNKALQQAKEETYNFQVHANSRNQTYSANDLFILNWASYECMYYVSVLERVYGTITNFNGLDEYTPEALVTAMGFNYSDCKKNYSHMLFDINRIISRTRQLWAPNNLPIVSRYFQMSQNIYKDGNSVKSQYYMFVPTVFHELTSNTLGSFRLEPISAWADTLSGTFLTWESAINIADQMITAVMEATDRGTMMGDALKAFDMSGLLAIPEISSDYKTVPIYDANVLMQIENATACGIYQDWIAEDVANNLVTETFSPLTSWTETGHADLAGNALMYGSPSTHIMNFHQLEDPSPLQVALASMYKTAGNRAQSSGNAFVPETSGTEMISYFTIWYYQESAEFTKTLRYEDLTSFGYAIPSTNGGVWTTWTATAFQSTTVTTVGVETPFVLMTPFDWSPWMYKTVLNIPYDAKDSVGDNGLYDIEIAWALGDFDNYTIISSSELKRIHTALCLDSFGVRT